jgi:general secretion pathway protein N
MKLKTVALVAGATFFLGLLFLAPARLINSMLPQEVSLDGVAGSLWEGSSRQLLVQGIGLGQLTWDFKPSRLLAGKAGYDLRLDLPGGSVSATALIGLGGSVSLQHLQGSIPVDYLTRGKRLGKLEGRVSVNLERALLDKGWPVEMAGILAVGNLTQMVPKTTLLGTYQAEFDGQKDANGALVGKIKTLAAPLDVSGLVSIAPDRSYRVDVLISVTQDTPSEMREFLPLLAADQGNGRYLYQQSGSM